MNIRVTTDRDAGATYIWLRPAKPGLVARTDETPDGMHLDFDAADNLVGIEILDLAEVTVEDITHG